MKFKQPAICRFWDRELEEREEEIPDRRTNSDRGFPSFRPAPLEKRFLSKVERKHELALWNGVVEVYQNRYGNLVYARDSTCKLNPFI